MAINMIEKTKKYKATLEELEQIGNQLMECMKNNQPFENIVCPKCGGKIIFTEIGNSHTVKCETPYCISYSVRGL